MVKKQLLCCMVVGMLVIVSNLHSYNNRLKSLSAKKQNSKSDDRYFQEDISSVSNSHYFASLDFANEPLPLGDKSIEKTMRQYLHSFLRNHKVSKIEKKEISRSLEQVSDILKQHNIPEDFKYIPLIESGFLNGTSSHRGASGYWQFMPTTARAYGLKVNQQIDDRQDLEKSTLAAAKYLTALYEEFKSWTLVAAAYNIGSGNLQRAIRHQEEDNYFRLKLNRETSSYVYKLILAKAYYENPKALNEYRSSRKLVAEHQEEKESWPNQF